jgi:pimeloyl-ACP methyl ester carboxylesterase
LITSAKRLPWGAVQAVLALLAMALGAWQLHAATRGVATEATTVDGTPVTIFRAVDGAPAPVVVIAHGFAGSQQLMQSFALALARAGYIAVTFDFAGHGRNPTPLAGSITEVDGATRSLVAETARIAAFARGLGDGRLAVLGHSMASDIVVRFAQQTPDVAATIAVSMFSPAVTADTPRNLLVIVGDWEGMLKTEALRAVGLASAPALPEAGVTYGDPAAGSGRRAAWSPGVEHVGVLYSRDSLAAAIDWLDRTFGIGRAMPPVIDSRGPWIALLLAGVVALARPLARALPVVADPPCGAGLRWRSLWPLLLVPMLATPLLLRVLPTHFLPVLVADYLAAHFALYGVITAACLAWQRRRAPRGVTIGSSHSRPALIVAALAITAYAAVGIGWPLDTFVASFVPGAGRGVLVLALLVGTASWFLADEWLTRGQGAARGAYAASKLAFVVSLAIAVALDFERLFFLVIIVPVIALFFLVHGLFSAWAYRRTGHPWAAGIANAVVFAWAIGVTFPLLAG